MALPLDRALALYLFAVREHADEETRSKIDEALAPPLTARRDGVPAWYGSDDDAWSQFSQAFPQTR